MANLKNAVESYLISQGYRYTSLDNGTGYRYGISGKDCSSMRVVITVRDRGFSCYAISPVNIPENRRPAIADFITRANYGMNYGTFEMDFSDGEIRVRTCLFCADQVPPMKAIEEMVDLPPIMLDRYFNGINAVLYGNIAPSAAIQQIEG